MKSSFIGTAGNYDPDLAYTHLLGRKWDKLNAYRTFRCISVGKYGFKQNRDIYAPGEHLFASDELVTNIASKIHSVEVYLG